MQQLISKLSDDPTSAFVGLERFITDRRDVVTSTAGKLLAWKEQLLKDHRELEKLKKLLKLKTNQYEREL